MSNTGYNRGRFMMWNPTPVDKEAAQYAGLWWGVYQAIKENI